MSFHHTCQKNLEPRAALLGWVNSKDSYFAVISSGKEYQMLYYALLFLVIALVAAIFGFGGIASASAGIAQILFVVFVLLFIGTLLVRAVRN